VTISRSLIFIPGNNPRFLEKAKIINADIICFDLEDSVPIEQKENARELIKKTILEINRNADNKKNIISVRINSPESGLLEKDLKKVIVRGLDAIAIPKVNNEKEIVKISKVVETYEKENNLEKNSIKLMPSIESAIGVINAFTIARSSERNSALIFGIFDFLHDMKIDNYNDDILNSFMYARAKVPVDARAAGINSIDSIWQNIKDNQGLVKDSAFGKKLGYNGKCIIHPSQIEEVHKVFSPSMQDIEWARKVIASLDKYTDKNTDTKRGAISLEGKMIDAVHYKQAKRIIETIEDERLQQK
jgi:citrate lyase subunit beta/citryl-CoA lyase